MHSSSSTASTSAISCQRVDFIDEEDGRAEPTASIEDRCKTLFSLAIPTRQHAGSGRTVSDNREDYEIRGVGALAPSTR
eukprot:scaffold123426_cov31-Tisochrysis_lutea.AAC.2